MSNSTKKPTDEELAEQLKGYREQIDAVDAKLLALLIERQQTVKKVGALKKKAGKATSIIRPGREADMVRSIAGKGNADMRGEVLAHIWRQIISAAINLEEKTRIAVSVPPQKREAYWLTREHFGMFTPMEELPTDSDVVQKLLARDATIGVISIEEESHGQPWWRMLCDQEDRPAVFARLPFLRMAPSAKQPLLAMGYVEPERTGKDESLWVINVPENVAWPMVEDVMIKRGVKLQVLDKYTEWGVPSYGCYLILCDGFYDRNSLKMAKILTEVNEDVGGCNAVELHYIGSYSTPLKFFEGE